jgi:hypothetical protein
MKIESISEEYSFLCELYLIIESIYKNKPNELSKRTLFLVRNRILDLDKFLQTQ